MLVFLDYLLFIFHVLVIAFNLFGWIPSITRKGHFVVVGLTLFSWIVLGFWKGWGYCLITDWHWDIKRELGETALPGSFIQYLTNNIFGFEWSRTFVDGLTLFSFLLAISCAVVIHFLRNKKQMSC